MKRGKLGKLLPLIKAKTQLEKFVFEQIRCEQDSLLQRAAMLRKTAMQPMVAGRAEKSSVSFLAHGERHASQRLGQARMARLDADKLSDAAAAQRDKVVIALQREHALAQLALSFEKQQRTAQNKREEGRHEGLQIVRALEPPDV